VNEQIRKIQEHIFAKYVDLGDHGTLDEDAALRILEDHYKKPENAADSECCYLGILYFEHGFEDEARKVDYFRRARYWLSRSKALSQEAWDAVDDRLADIAGFFESEGLPADASTPDGGSGAAAALLPSEIEHHGAMVLVPAGAFFFGPRNESRSLPAFYVDKFPVTNRQYETFYRATNYRKPKYADVARFNQPEQPVVGVSVADAVKYCRWVGKELPSEEQWEKAARGVDGRTYPWGNEGPRDGIASWGGDPEESGPSPVTAHPRNVSPWGARELAGSVWEWTSTTLEDGETFHVVKGGCYSDPAPFLQSNFRLEAGPKDKFENIGFRCVKPA
jgi:formylglycine-generating enzyme required for sulfatase activity